MRFSYFKKQIDPDAEPYYLVGFGKTREPKEEFFGLPELWLKICWISAAEGNNLVFITLDTLYFSRDFTDEIYDALFHKYNLTREQIIFNASHTHSAPNISVPEWDNIHSTYSLKIKTGIYEGIEYCSKNLGKGIISYQDLNPPDKLFISRRKLTFSISSPFRKKVHRLPNVQAEVDNSIRTITLYDQAGIPTVVIYNLSCHPVFNRNNNYSSDFVGVVSYKLEQQVKMAMFLQGFSGDIRANYYGSINLKSIRRLLFNKLSPVRNLLFLIKLFLDRKIFIPADQAFFKWFTEKIYTTIIVGYTKGTQKSEIDLYNKSFTFSLESETGKTQKEFVTTINQLDHCLFISIPAEVNSSYFLAIEKKVTNKLLFTIGCTYDMIGYLPMSYEIDEGGYEVESFVNYGWDSQFSKKSLTEYKSALIENCD